MGWIQNSLGLDLTGEWSQIVNINVGGVAYTCLRKTFLNHQNNPVFSSLLDGSCRKSDDGSFVIDRDGTTFRHILNFLRSGGKLVLPDKFDEWELLLDDAKYYHLKDLEEAILALYEYQQKVFRRSLPQAVCLNWNLATGAASITPQIPALTSNPNGVGLHYQGKHTLASVEECVATILSVYGYVIQHWRTVDNQRECIFFTLAPH